LICLRAAEGVGVICADKTLKKVRRLINRLLWQMNDESGALCWYGAEVLGEILANVPELLKDYRKIVTNFVDEEPFERGGHYAMWRLCRRYREKLPRYADILAASAESEDSAICAYSIKGLCELRDSRAVELMNGPGMNLKESILFDPDRGDFVEISADELKEQIGSIF